MLTKIETDLGFISRAALFSNDERYRYRLRIVWDPDLPYVCFIGLNPSIADELKDDPTIRRCVDFAKRWGKGGIAMLNLFAYRATDPRELKRAANPIGPENTLAFLALEVLKSRSVPIAAWGAFPMVGLRASEVMRLEALHCLGTTKGGFPRHPALCEGRCAAQAIYERQLLYRF